MSRRAKYFALAGCSHRAPPATSQLHPDSGAENRCNTGLREHRFRPSLELDLVRIALERQGALDEKHEVERFHRLEIRLQPGGRRSPKARTGFHRQGVGNDDVERAEE